MLEHAVTINAQEQYQRIIAAMIPHISKTDREKIMNDYTRLIGNDRASGGIMNNEHDRKRLKVLLSKIKK